METINTEQQRIAIAEACGWRIKRRDITGFNVWEPDAKLPAQLSNNLENKIPNYLNDLNAMHDAENVLTNEQWWLFVEFLTEIRGGGVALCISATAAQRAKAFLKTLSLWTE